MKTKIAKVSLALFVIAAAVSLSSFTGSKKFHNTPEKVVIKTYETEYAAVTAYINENILTPIREQGKSNGVKLKSFSRCPSGYQSRIASKSDSVKTDVFVHGKIVLYKGCSPDPVCDYRVCVDKGIAEVRNKGEKEYISVREWLDHNDFKKDDDAKPVKESPKEVKG